MRQYNCFIEAEATLPGSGNCRLVIQDRSRRFQEGLPAQTTIPLVADYAFGQ